jgi:hypothetical protein
MREFNIVVFGGEPSAMQVLITQNQGACACANADRFDSYPAGGVGKSALTVRFVRDVFVTNYDPTIEGTQRRALPLRSHIVDCDNAEAYRRIMELDEMLYSVRIVSHIRAHPGVFQNLNLGSKAGDPRHSRRRTIQSLE